MKKLLSEKQVLNSNEFSMSGPSDIVEDVLKLSTYRIPGLPNFYVSKNGNEFILFEYRKKNRYTQNFITDGEIIVDPTVPKVVHMRGESLLESIIKPMKKKFFNNVETQDDSESDFKELFEIIEKKHMRFDESDKNNEESQNHLMKMHRRIDRISSTKLDELLEPRFNHDEAVKIAIQKRNDLELQTSVNPRVYSHVSSQVKETEVFLSKEDFIPKRIEDVQFDVDEVDISFQNGRYLFELKK